MHRVDCQREIHFFDPERRNPLTAGTQCDKMCPASELNMLLHARRDGWVVESTGLENRRCESIRGFESHSLRQLNFSIDLRKYPRGRRGSPAKGVGRVKSAAEVQILSSAPRKARENIVFSLAFSFILPCFAKKSSILAFQKMPLPLSLPQLDFLPLKTAERSSTGWLTSGASFYAFFSFS